MQHMRENARKNRGLYIIVAALIVVYSLEPSMVIIKGVCVRMFDHISSGLYK